jgi:hypothetical protein
MRGRNRSWVMDVHPLSIFHKYFSVTPCSGLIPYKGTQIKD